MKAIYLGIIFGLFLYVWSIAHFITFIESSGILFEPIPIIQGT